MAITKSAKRALRQSLKRRAGNLVYKNKMKSLIKEARSSLRLDLLPQVYKALDKAAKVNVIKKNTASRLKSRITKLIAKSR